MTVDPRFWNRIAESYAAKPVENPEAFERKIAITKALMTPDDVVLDIGCGTGSLVLRLAPEAAEVHGLDLSEEMIRIARNKARDQGVENASFHVGAIEEGAPFGPGSLDGVLAYSLLHLVEDRATTLKGMFELLKPGGFFVSSTVCLGGGWFPYGPMLSVMRLLGQAPMVKVFPPSTIRADIEAAGFVDVTAHDVGAKPNIAFLVARKPTG